MIILIPLCISIKQQPKTTTDYNNQQATMSNPTTRVFTGTLQNPTEFSSNFKSTISKNAEKFRDLLEQHKNKNRWLNRLQDWVIMADTMKPERFRKKMVEDLNSAIKKNKKLQYLFENESWFYTNIVQRSSKGRENYMDIELHNRSHPTMKENYHYDNYYLPLERLVKKIIAIELPAPKKQKLIIRKKKICSREVYLGDGVYIDE